MNLKALLLGLVSILYLFGANWFYSKNHPEDCCPTEVIAPAKEKKERGPLMFNWSNEDPLTSDSKFPAFKTKILENNKDGQILEITGKYFEGETTPDGYSDSDLGIARAEAIWKKHFPEVDAANVRIKSQMVPETDGVRTEEFASASFKWADAPKEAPKVIETTNSATVYFDFNGTKGKLNKEVDDYLQRIANRLKDGNEKVIITGHTDNIGGEASNLALGERRAKTVRDVLKRYGVDASRITTNSKGETDPADNRDTDAARAKNRRAYVEIIK